MALQFSVSQQEVKIGSGWEGRGCPVVVRGVTSEYRRALLTFARDDDIAVEIGSAAGVATIQLARRCLLTFGVDASAGEVEGAIKNATREGVATSLEVSTEEAGNERPAVQFIVARVSDGDDCEASLEPLAAALGRVGRNLRDITLLGIDVAGTAELERVTPLIVSLRRVMRPRMTIVKSLSLRKLIVAIEAGESLCMV